MFDAPPPPLSTQELYNIISRFSIFLTEVEKRILYISLIRHILELGLESSSPRVRSSLKYSTYSKSYLKGHLPRLGVLVTEIDDERPQHLLRPPKFNPVREIKYAVN